MPHSQQRRVGQTSVSGLQRALSKSGAHSQKLHCQTNYAQLTTVVKKGRKGQETALPWRVTHCPKHWSTVWECEEVEHRVNVHTRILSGIQVMLSGYFLFNHIKLQHEKQSHAPFYRSIAPILHSCNMLSMCDLCIYHGLCCFSTIAPKFTLEDDAVHLSVHLYRFIYQ